MEKLLVWSIKFEIVVFLYILLVEGCICWKYGWFYPMTINLYHILDKTSTYEQPLKELQILPPFVTKLVEL
jgi:hypothetical protein